MADFAYYDDDDLGFEGWLSENPKGYVLNYYPTGKLHTASCKTYLVHGKPTHTRPKACSTSKQPLFELAAQKGWDAPEHCQQCFG
jgi:hypothetical protein